MNDLTTRFSSLSEEKKKMLALRMQGKKANKINTTEIIPQKYNENEPVPMSFAQKRLWFLNEMEPGNAFYNMFTALQLSGPVQIKALEESFNVVLDRHEVLRSSFYIKNGQPVQRISSSSHQNIPVIDLTNLPEEERLTEAHHLAKKESQTPFELSKAPLIRMKLIKMKNEDFLLFLNIHHIVADGWSISVFVRELCALYDSYSNGQEPLLPVLPIQYSDFAYWQQEHLKGPELEKQLTFWKEQLGGTLPVLQLPADRARPSIQTFNGARYAEVIDDEIMEGVKKLSRQENTTLYMTFLAVFKVLLHKYTGLEDLLVGSPVANRGRLETEGLIGLFVNTIVLRTNLSKNQSFIEFLNRVRAVSLNAYAHQDLPFEKLVEVLQPNRDMSYSPLFQVMFILNEPHSQTKTNKVMGFTLEKTGLHITPLEIDNNTAKYDLTINIDERQPDGWVCALEYNTDLFEEQTIKLFMEHFIHLIKEVVKRPDQKISQMSLLTETEEDLLKKWNDTKTEDDLSTSFLELYQGQVEAKADEVAIVYGENSLSYRELDQKANQLAHHLMQYGAKPGCLVGICLDRSLEMVIGMLAILKAGAAYVPIDPSYPKQRVSYMVQQSGMQFLLTDSASLPELPQISAKVVFIDKEANQIASCSIKTPNSGVTPEDLAYVIYTSGSTGNPKGVQIQHRALTNFMFSMKRILPVVKDDTFLSITSISFDISNLEIYLPLISGIKLVVADTREIRDPKALDTLFIKHGITMIQATPATFRMLIESGWKNNTLKKVLCGGEAMSGELAKALLNQGVELWNMYGPTETTIWSTFERVESDERITIGHPIGNTELYILDDNYNKLPVGVPGELYIGGEGLALGYLNNPYLTEERFIPNPFSKEEGDRIYRTGDLVRYLSTGKVEYLGRIDDQVKVRGFRIELGEIEAVLEKYPEVKQAVVVLRKDHEENNQIVGYVTANSEKLTVNDLLTHMRDFLPEYMIPSMVMLIDDMPLTPNGKVDRKGLPEPDVGTTSMDIEFIPPRDDIEENIAEIWRQVLHRIEVGVHDNFFALGGHSILVTQVLSRIQEIYQVEIPLRNFFARPTIEGNANFIKSKVETVQVSNIATNPNLGELVKKVPASVAQKRMWLLHHLDSNNQQGVNSFTVYLQGKLDVQTFQLSINNFINRHESMRTLFSTEEGEIWQSVYSHMEVALQFYDLRGREEPYQYEIQQKMLQEVKGYVDPVNGPLFKVLLLQKTNEEYLALFAVHQLIMDKGSFSVFLREVTEQYDGYIRGELDTITATSTQFSDFIRFQNERLTQIPDQLAFWEKHLSGEMSSLQLLTDYPRPAVLNKRASTERIGIPSVLYSKLRNLCIDRKVSMDKTFLAVFAILLHRYTNQIDFSIGVKTSNRKSPFWSEVVGPIENSCVLRTDFNVQLPFTGLLQHMEKLMEEAKKYNEVPFETLINFLEDKNDMSRSAYFQASFESAAGVSEYQVQGVSFKLVDSETYNDCDITLSLTEIEEECQVKLVYNAELFDKETIRRMSNHFLSLLFAVSESPEQSISDLPMLSEKERNQILVEWNNTGVAYPADETILHQFERQALKRPDAIAVTWKDQTLTYGQLNGKANQLARHLQKRGIGRESLVGIAVERTPDMIVGILGILKAGGAYLPLDPNYPYERIEYILEDGQATLLLTQEGLLERLPKSGAEPLCLDTDWADIAVESTENLPSIATSDNLAYVIYTSGSTGQPKGVAICHRSAVALIHWAKKLYTEEELAGVLASTSLSFDLSVFEIFVTLSAGGGIILAENALDLPHLPAREQVTLINTVPSAINELLKMDAIPQRVRTVNLAGEALRSHLVEQLYDLDHIERVYNLYGPSEDTTYSTFSLVPRNNDRNPTIGKPISNTQLYVLDGSMQPVPIGVAGELYIGGDGLAREYLNRRELTAEKFVVNPFAAEGKGRLYKTGDLVRYLANGELEYIGRLDHQVKVRGFRIELGEIEARLVKKPEVRDAVVLVREDVPGDKRIVAYVCATDTNVEAETLRGEMQKEMPAYMVPSAFVVMDAFPLTPNGKIDRKLLPKPDFQTLLSKEDISPRNPIEEAVAGIWASVLGLEQIGIHDDFFKLGGHSLLATQAVSRMNTALKVKVTLRTLFEAPTVAQISNQIERLHQEDISPIAILPVNEGDRVSLSFAQQQFWVMDRLLADGSVYNMPYVFRLDGLIDIQVLEKSLNYLIERHSILRTVFVEEDRGPVQKITPASWMPLPVINIEEDFEETVRTKFNQERQYQFDLSEGPLIRFSLLSKDEKESMLLLNLHHIIGDGWSMGILTRELIEIYSYFLKGEEPSLPNLPIQYADYANWQREWLQGDVLEQQMEYWKDQLGGEIPVLQLPSDRQRPAVQSYRGASETFVIPDKLTSRLKQFGQSRGSTLFMTLLAAFQALLSRYSGQEDIAVGTPVAGRSQEETEGLIGCFVNTLVMRTDLSGNPSFEELVDRVREVALGAYMHQDVPFELLVDKLVENRNLSHSPLFQVMFILQNTPTYGGDDASSIKLGRVETENGTSKFDLTLEMSETHKGLSGSIEFNTDLFDNETIRRLIGHFKTLLEQVILQPAKPIFEVPLLVESEHHKLLREWNNTGLAYPADETILHQFERQALKRPDAIAVTWKDQTLTYGQLNGKANQLARHLQKRGIGRESLVGIAVERTPDMIVGILGILKAGGAYLPLDPNYPYERIEYILEDGQATLLLTQERLLERLPKSGAEPLCLDTDWADIAVESTENLPSIATSDNLAYVIYTSGSTGQPKGVAICHRSAVALIHWAKKLYTEEELAGVLASTSLSFDLSVFEIFVTLSAGGGIILAENALDLPHLPAREQVTLINTVPSAINELLKMDAIPQSVRTVNLAGEALRSHLVEQLYDLDHIERVYNLYGPSEDTTYSTYSLVPRNNDRNPTIGRPISNTQLYVLDGSMQPVPIGVAGELYIGGDGLAREYLNRRELTAEKFVVNPFTAEGKGRLYKTGDLVRYLANGELEYIGRLDHQVKVRGFRIELGEIEARLVKKPEVRDAVVLVREDVPGDKRIVAYVCATDTNVEAETLRGEMQKEMPAYMVPSAFVVMEAFPLTPNGKLDRKALPIPVMEQESLTSIYLEPSSQIEHILHEIWCEVLNLSRIGTQDNFFTLGGHSLLAAQVLTRIQDKFKFEITMIDFFANPTIAYLSLHIERIVKAQKKTGGQPLMRISRKGKVPLSLSQQRLWFLHQLDPNGTNYNIPFAVRLQGSLNIDAFRWSLNEIIRRHEALRTVFREYDGEPEQIILDELELSMDFLDISQINETDRQEECINLISKEAAKPFDLVNGPLLNVFMLRLTEDDYVVLLNIHHIISDGWSTTIIIREMATLYEAYCKGLPSPLPTLEMQYADYSYWQRERLQGEFLDNQMEYWNKKLGGDLPVLQLPTDRTRPPVMSHRGASIKFTLSKKVNEKLKKFSQENGTTLYMTLLAAYQTLLYRYSGQEDICVGTPIAVRNRPELEGMIGFLVNTLVMRTDLGGEPTFLELLDRVRDSALGAYAHQEVPFEKLAEEFQPERDMSRSLFFQAMFVLHNLPLMKGHQLPGLSMELVEFERNIANFDLTLAFIEQQGKLEGTLDYNTDIFEPSTMERFIKHYENLLESIMENPHEKISKLNLLPNEERSLILCDWKQESKLEVPLNFCVHQLIEQQVEMNPDAIAIEWKNELLTYRELNDKANRVANYLRKLGVGPDKMVGISVERSLEMIIGLLGILKAGGAYLPLDPAYPQERLAYMLEDSQVEVLLTQKHLESVLPKFEGTKVFLDHDWSNISKEPATQCVCEVSPDNLMYVIYTSGSTGRPKGVMASHKGVVNHNLAVIKEFELSKYDRVLQFASISFDIAVEEIFPTLITGATLVLWKDNYLASGVEFLSWIQEEKISILNLPTAYWHSWVNELIISKKYISESLRLVIVGGEKASTDVYESWIRLVGDKVRWVNTYGPTETTVTATLYEPNSQWVSGKPIPIGRPLNNVQVYVLDENMQPVPIGIPGELYIGGIGLAQGYLNRPDLTSEHFVEDPFSTTPNARLYKTGDIVRFLKDSNLEYVGRVDNQVKIRGYRIEVGEIESILEQHPDVYKSVVVADEKVKGQKLLVGYLVGNKSMDIGQITNFLKLRLPEYMIPIHWVILENLPLTPNGKVDLVALPSPEDTIMYGKQYIEPRNELEKAVAKIWGEVLNVPKVSVFHNFFEIGGHSLLATQVISRLNAALQTTVPLRLLFEYPELGDFTERIKNIQKSDKLPPIVNIEREKHIKSSFSQQRLWIMDQIMPESPVYNMPYAVSLHGDLDTNALKKSLEEIVKRHEILRTVFDEVKGDVVQIILEPTSITLQLIDLIELSDSEREVKLSQKIKEEAEHLFNLKEGPLIRFLLVSKSKEEHVLILNMHHIISDGWSTSILIRELVQLYEAFTNSKQKPLQNLSIQYADFAHWQREYLQGEVMEKQLEYWKNKLTGELPVLQLPTTRIRQSVQSHRGITLDFHLDKGLSEDLKRLSSSQGVTMFMTLMAAFQTLLYRYSGQEDICVGTPVAGRNHKETEDLIGFFVNTLVIRNSFSGNPTFLELLKQVSSTALDAYQNQDIPFERLVEELQPERDMSQTPLFQTMFVMQNLPTESINIPGLSLRPLKIESQVSKFDLTLTMEEQKQGISCSFEFNLELFDTETIVQMFNHLHNLLVAITKYPEQSINNLPMLSEKERNQILVEWNNTGVAYPADETILHQFERQALKRPDAIAVTWKDQTLTYGQLNGKANQLARHLQKRGIGRESLVGIAVERTPDMIVGILGILKAGGAYLPLDPNYPYERIEYILEDGQATLLLTQEGLLERLPKSGAEPICLDTDWADIAVESTENLPSIATSDNLAYVIYTSGSTGQPKGVAICHRSAVALIHWAKKLYTEEELAGVLASTSLSFDLSVFEIFVTLSAGGGIILAENALDLPQLPAREQVTLINTVPSAINELLKMDAIPQSVRTVNLAGEALRSHLVEQLYDLDHIERVYNLYGPSEDTTYSTYSLVPRNNDRNPTIGRPISNTQLYVLDGSMQPVPIGVAGELYIGGDGLAREYLNRRELTAEKFVVNPFTAEGKGRLYKTGDLVRYLANGELEYIGRLDHQVKVRGFRIELGEIEARLVKKPEVRDAVVLVREDVPGDKRIVAYVCATDTNVEAETLRGEMQKEMPAYMVPSAFVMMDAFPLTPNGKIDRKLLPKPDFQTLLSKEDISPHNPIEEAVAGIWASVLGLEQIGIHDDFFKLGGHSLLATQAVSRMNAALKVKVTLRTLFEAPTVAQISNQIERLHQEDISPIAILPVNEGDRVSLSFAQQQFWVMDRLLADGSVYNMPYVFRLDGLIDIQVLEKSLNYLIERHSILRTVFVEEDRGPVQKITPASWMPLPVINIEEDFEETVRTKFNQERQYQFDLSEGPLIRFSLLSKDEKESMLLLNLHHIIGDGWSMGILTRELIEIYSYFLKGEEPSLPNLPIQYADYANWQREWLQGDVLEQQMEYWKDRLGGEIPVLQLPSDRQRPAVQSYRGASETFVIPDKLTSRLKEFGQSRGSTLFMTLLAAFQALLSRYSGQEDIAVGTPVAGRSKEETEGLIGCFINTLVMRTDLSGSPSFEELVDRVREVALGAYMHQDVPFEFLVDKLVENRNLSHAPLFQVMFILQNTPTYGGDDASSVKLGRVETENGTSKFDLTLEMSETHKGLGGSIEFNTDLFDNDTIHRMIGHFKTLLEQVILQPAKPIFEVPLLIESEHHKLLHEWNNTELAYPADETILHQFERQALKRPDAIAVTWKDQTLTYGQLNGKANQLALHLQKRGIGRESLVGIAVERTPDMIVGILGILKAGGAYLPLDPNYPYERIEYILEDGQATLLLTQERLLERLPKSGAEPLCLDTDWADIAVESTENLPSIATSDNLAYVIYTSGSTGQPKGVAICHRSAVALIHWAKKLYTEEELAGVLASTSLSFDLSVFEIFVTLSAGGGIILAENALDLPHLPAREQVTLINTVPSAINELLKMDAIPQSVRTVNLAGEALRSHLVEQLYDLDHIERVYNLYGPSEDTTYSTYSLVPRNNDRNPTIGRPISNTQLYVLDGSMQPVPIGVAGELYIGGDGLAREYLNRRELTAEKFVVNPFAAEGKGRLYKTGDQVRYLPNGELEYIGRLDHQVKVRGFRIELGEIEARLVKKPEVRDAVVLVREDVPGDKRIVAYVCVTDSNVGAETLRGEMQKEMPAYMVPSAFVVMDAFPLTPNGKVNRKGLPAPNQERDKVVQYLAPRDFIESQLVYIWEELFEVRPIGIKDNFFELGGHSLLAVRLTSLIKKKMGHSLPLALLFQSGTIEELAQIIRHEGELIQTSNLVRIKGGSQTPLFLVHPIGGNVLCYRELAGVIDKDQTVYGLQSPGLHEGTKPLSTIEEMAKQYIEEIKILQPQGPYYLGGWSIGGIIAYEMAQQLMEQGEKVNQLTLIDSYLPNIEEVTLSEEILATSFVKDLIGMNGKSIPGSLRKLKDEMGAYNLNRREWLKALMNSGLISVDLTEENLERLVDVFSANANAINCYKPKPMKGVCPTLFRAKQGDLEGMKGWLELTDNIKVYSMSANHYTIMKKPNVRIIAKKMKIQN
ncbi:non-ribosomal peptide synthase/polyketide synthase [Cytobacillus pseudoceanisediminis]|uniref:Non-ribosomal peptide synthase/polyketide synthase n=1 Tax=Cytobacillus pseudoceanisediminis TaxID=3051614 RepID=A0ABZ2ZLR7_9BACI